MKLRYGFVSNSSSSSFLVRRERERWIPYPGEENTGRVTIVYDVILTPEQEQALTDFGFMSSKHWLEEERLEYSYEVSCNQDCVAKFLIKNKIPFTARVHYGQESWFWDGESENIVCFVNYGSIHEMYGLLNEYERADGKTIEEKYEEKAGYNISIKGIVECESEDCKKYGKLCEGTR